MEESGRPRAPFQVLPQRKVHRRAVTFGKEQVAELVMLMLKDASCQGPVNDILASIRFRSTEERKDEHLEDMRQKIQELERRREQHSMWFEDRHKKPPDVERFHKVQAKRQDAINKKRKTFERESEAQGRRKRQKTNRDTGRFTREQVSDRAEDIAKRLFRVPKHLAKRWDGVVTTDGTVASWHLSRPGAQTSHPRGRKKVVERRVDRLERKHYGVRRTDACFTPAVGPLNVIAVDPGHHL